MPFTIKLRYGESNPVNIMVGGFHKPKEAVSLLMCYLDYFNYTKNRPTQKEFRKKALKGVVKTTEFIKGTLYSDQDFLLNIPDYEFEIISGSSLAGETEKELSAKPWLLPKDVFISSPAHPWIIGQKRRFDADMERHTVTMIGAFDMCSMKDYNRLPKYELRGDAFYNDSTDTVTVTVPFNELGTLADGEEKAYTIQETVLPVGKPPHIVAGRAAIILQTDKD